MEAVIVRVGGLVFDQADYDAEGDVLYTTSEPPQVAEAEETPEDHVLRFAPGSQRIVGLTVIGARRPADRDGCLVVTIPETVEARADVAAALATA